MNPDIAERREKVARIVNPTYWRLIEQSVVPTRPYWIKRRDETLAKADDIEALYSGGVGDGWRDIASAPFDPEWSVLGWAPGMDAAVEMAWRADFKGWLTRGGAILEPTHWCPLPPPPAQEVP